MVCCEPVAETAVVVRKGANGPGAPEKLGEKLGEQEEEEEVEEEKEGDRGKGRRANRDGGREGKSRTEDGGRQKDTEASFARGNDV